MFILVFKILKMELLFINLIKVMKNFLDLLLYENHYMNIKKISRFFSQ